MINKQGFLVIIWLTFLFSVTMLAYTKPVGLWELCHSVVNSGIDSCAKTGGVE